MANNKNNKAAQKNNDAAVPSTDVAPVSSEQPSAPSVAEKKALFADFEAADKEVQAQETAVELAKVRRSEAVKAIADRCGKGPFDFNGRILSVTTRIEKSGEGDDAKEHKRFYFKGSRKTVETI